MPSRTRAEAVKLIFMLYSELDVALGGGTGREDHCCKEGL